MHPPFEPASGDHLWDYVKISYPEPSNRFA
jgi:hypothetical protein